MCLYSIAIRPLLSTLTPFPIISGIDLTTFMAYSLASDSFKPLAMA